ncbi:MAG: DUF3810 domain-containing protein [Tannerella sp.]|jgi:hypothetical protein|nr:DUF3810 domain-containing protein [Tannerella sp.]
MKQSHTIKLALTALLLFAVVFAVSRAPGVAEWYIVHIYPALATVLSTISALFPFSLYDLFILFLIIAFIMLVILMIIRKIRWGKGLRIIARSVIILIAWFYVAWGFAYFRQDFYTRCGMQQTAFDSTGFKSFADNFIADANRAYISVSEMNKDSIHQKIERQYDRLHTLLKINYPNGKRRTKPMMFESIYTKTGISGYFGPFFNEVHVNDFVLDMEYPFTLAHEKAHQFGVASEAECNLYAFIVCATSDDAQLRYSAYLSTMSYVLSNYRRTFPDGYRELLSKVDGRIINDLRTNSEHWMSQHNQTIDNVHREVYNTYLKTNKIKTGIQNYSEVVSLLLSTYPVIISEYNKQ